MSKTIHSDMYRNIYNRFGSLNFGEISTHGHISNNTILDYSIEDWFESEEPGVEGFELRQDPVYPTDQVSCVTVHENFYAQAHNEETSNPRDDATQTVSTRIKRRVAFKTKSDMEILDDGFKWRKYGKKMVKNNPNPRNYYKCSVEKCLVKKRVERDNEDPRYVITTYEGAHNHASPSG